MLLLVLILVLIAFGLLVVAMLSSSVLWAWVSVGVSVAAAAVLLVDWLQRRNAVQAGAGTEPETASDPGSDAPRAANPTVDIEPVTEILPVIPRSEPVPGVTAQGAGDRVDARFDPVADSQQTVVMPVVQPSGSTGRPSGATAGNTPSGGSSSPSVVEPDADRSSSTPPSSPAGDVSDHPSSDPAVRPAVSSAAEPTVAVAMGKGAAPAASLEKADRAGASGGPDVPEVSGSGSPDPDPPDPDTPGSDRSESDSSGASVRPAVPDAPAAAAEPPAVSEPAVSEPAARTSAEAGPAAPEPAPDATVAMQRDAEPPAGRPAEAVDEPAGSTPVDPLAGGPVSGGPPPDPEATVMVDTRKGPSGGTTRAEPAPTESPITVAAEDVEAAPPGPDGEPPEEPHDADVAALIAGLADEVVVVDERPRYHVAGCRSLVGLPLIPIPAGEAVELGFTPCGWCSPDRALASRHRTPAR